MALRWQGSDTFAMEATQLEIPGLESDPAVQRREEAQERLRIEENRVRLLEALYAQVGRDDRTKPHHHTYTGLAARFHEGLGRAITNQLLASPGFKPECLVGDLEFMTKEVEP